MFTIRYIISCDSCGQSQEFIFSDKDTPSVTSVSRMLVDEHGWSVSSSGNGNKITRCKDCIEDEKKVDSKVLFASLSTDPKMKEYLVDLYHMGEEEAAKFNLKKFSNALKKTSRISGRDIHVLNMRVVDGKTYSAIGEDMGVSGARVLQIFSSTKISMRHPEVASMLF